MPLVRSRVATVSEGWAPCSSQWLRALLVELDRRGLGLRVVLADRLDRAPVARRAFVGDDDAPDRVLLRTHPSKSDSDCHWAAAG